MIKDKFSNFIFLNSSRLIKFLILKAKYKLVVESYYVEDSNANKVACLTHVLYLVFKIDKKI